MPKLKSLVVPIALVGLVLLGGCSSSGGDAGSGDASGVITCATDEKSYGSIEDASVLPAGFPTVDRAPDCIFQMSPGQISVDYCGFADQGEVDAFKADLVASAVGNGWEVTAEETGYTDLKFGDNSHLLRVNGDTSAVGSCGDDAPRGNATLSYQDLQAR